MAIFRDFDAAIIHGTRPLSAPVNASRREGRSPMRGGWAATILAIIMAIIGIVLMIGGTWLVALGGSPYYLIAGVALLVSAWLLFRGRLARRMDLYRAFHPDCDVGFHRIARQCLGDGAVARSAARDPHLDPACHANARAARTQAVGRCMGRGHCCDHLCRRELRALSALPAARARRLAVAELARLRRPFGYRDWRGLDGLWRHQRRMALHAADADQSPDNVGKLRKVWEVHRRWPTQKSRIT